MGICYTKTSYSLNNKTQLKWQAKRNIKTNDEKLYSKIEKNMKPKMKIKIK